MTGEIRLTQRIRASRAELWRACSTTEGLERWYADRITGALSPGGRLVLEWPALGAAVELEVAEVNAGERVVFRNGQSRVTLTPGDGELGLAHQGLAATDDLSGFESSWRIALSLLAQSVEVHPAERRTARWFIRRTRTKPELAHLYFTEREALAAWLGSGGPLGPEGSRYALDLDGRPMSGKVLVRAAGRDVALSWHEDGDSVVVFRTLPSPASERERLVGAWWSRWGESGEERPPAAETLERAVERLSAVLERSGAA
jgi:uncharacterized protein YndB with AHSA1/START domain